MQKNGFSRLVVIVSVVALVLLGLGGYSIWAKKTGAPPLSLPDIPSLITSERSLQGIWTFKELYVADPATGELKLQTDEGGKANSYFEFKGNMFCTSGRLDSNGKPYPCSKYAPFSVSGDTMSIQDPSQPIMTINWKIVSGNLEFAFEVPAGEGGKPQKVKFVLTKL